MVSECGDGERWKGREVRWKGEGGEGGKERRDRREERRRKSTYVSLRLVEHQQDPSLLVENAVEDFVEDHL